MKANLFIGIALGLYLDGLFGLCVGYVVANLINMVPSLYFAGKLIGMKVVEQFSNILSVLLCSNCYGWACLCYRIPNA